MKKIAAMVALCGLVCGMSVVNAEPPKSEAKAGAKEKMPANASVKASEETKAKFEKMKKLAGVWQTADENKDGTPDSTIIYKLVSGGSAVAEYLMPGSEHEMVTMYHLDGDSIIATHYCSLGNQPRMRSKAGGDSNKLAFEFIDGTNMLSKDDMHIHSLVMTFSSDDSIIAEWKAYAAGKPSEHSPAFKATRVKDAEAAKKIVSNTMTCCSAGGAAACEDTKPAAKQ